MEFRETVDALAGNGDLLTVDEPVADPDLAFALAAESARSNGPAVLLTDVPGVGRLACGVRGGPDRMVRRRRLPWSRLAVGMGLPADATYETMLDVLSTAPAERPPLQRRAAAASGHERDASALCLPTVSSSDRPLVSEGLLAVEIDGRQFWAPVRGDLRGRTTLRLHVPATVADRLEPGSATVALGVPTAALMAAHLSCARTHPWRAWTAPEIAAALDDVPVAPHAGGLVPASAEIVLDGTVAPADDPAAGPRAAWESIADATSVTVSVDRVATRSDPLVPLAPVGEPLGDDIHQTSLVEGARLQARVNGYWGVSPVSWIGLPVEAQLGVCFVASEILYAGFEWQLANTLFSFATSFDKVVVLDADAAFEDLARALDDIWVKAHPSHDWVFSEAAAPAAAAPAYRRDGQTGSRLFVNAAWDPRWDEEFIAPEVNFEQMYPPEVRRTVEERWTELGFDGGNDAVDADDAAEGGESGGE
ncbi:UbiD family decarboxylase [Halogeometricum sp. S1BR25-6]|uniref:UbiD family decarboxylase n=1 Tax=Halogeometricum salsisoli TaxID=2950536 RepID=A0ABU2GID6_9EURY|nr:UbiD family decarboxylase domain-containing protein [Halogeometricum sp. S1BR25-6]MDS0300539.1 UbiD family decarboxylase [Halogeometricum sp. S1BR25-6]